MTTETSPPAEGIPVTSNGVELGKPFFSLAEVVNWMLLKSKERSVDLDPLKLQKLIYFAQGRCLRETKRPLVDEYAEAWPYGPVFPSAYHEYKKYGRNAIPYGELTKMTRFNMESGRVVPSRPIVEQAKNGSNQQAIAILEASWKKYAPQDGLTLSQKSHARDPDNPWCIGIEEAKKAGMRSVPIDNHDIYNYFQSHAEL